VVLDSQILDLSLAGLANLNTIYIRNAHLAKIDVRNAANLKQFVLKDLKLNEMDVVQSLSTGLSSLTLDNTENLFIDKSYFTGRPFYSLYSSINQLIQINRLALLNLKTLSLRSNRFLNDSVGVEIFKRLFSLERLDLSGNRIELLSQACFKDLAKLQSLDLNDNKLKAVSWSLFSGLERLEFLNMRNNSIRSILVSTEGAAAGGNLTCLKEIDLSFNLITSIEQFDFYAHYKLVKLNLKRNLIERFQVNAFDNLKNLTDLNLDRQMNGSLRQKSFYRSANCSQE